MASIVLGEAGFKEYQEAIGPGRGRPDRPRACPFCDGERVWFDGWRQVFVVVLANGALHRFDDGLWIKRACCAECETSWPLPPPFLYPHRSLEPDVAEAAAFAYLGDASATYTQVAAAHGCSPRTVWRWVGWIAGLVVIGELLAEAERLSGAGQAAALIPHAVPHDHAKAMSRERGATLLAAFQALVALAVWARAQPAPPADPSALRTWLAARFLAFREIHRFPRHSASPALPATPPARLGYTAGRELRRRHRRPQAPDRALPRGGREGAGRRGAASRGDLRPGGGARGADLAAALRA